MHFLYDIFPMLLQTGQRDFLLMQRSLCLTDCLREQGVVGSNPATPTKEKDFDSQ